MTFWSLTFVFLGVIRRKANWSQLKIAARIESFVTFMNEPRMRRPPGIDLALNKIREEQLSIGPTFYIMLETGLLRDIPASGNVAL